MENLCYLCPRECKIDRTSKLGFCGAKNEIVISKVMLHYFEEPPISGENTKGEKAHGSGAIFFSGCNLKCVFCQNYFISHKMTGKVVTTKKLADIFRQLENAGANNINLVTPTHYTSQIIEALKIYRPMIPIVWNTSGYESVKTIKMLKNYVDIYLTDFKYNDSELSKKYSFAENYPEKCRLATLEMRKNQPEDIFENGLMKKGIIVRHLVLPGQTKDTLSVIDWVNNNLGNKTYFSLMAQFVPMGISEKYPEINRKITKLEYKIPLSKLTNLGFTNVFVQDYTSATSDYTPDFESNKSDFDY